MMKQICFAVLCLVLGGCIPSTVPFTDPDPGAPCGWVESRQGLPDLSKEVQAALEGAGIAGAKAYAEAYGENCMDTKTQKARYFAAMETDYHITLAVDGLGDLEALGKLAADVLVVLDGFPPKETPGPRSGYVGLKFVAADSERRLWFTVLEWTEARDQGLAGSALLEALGW